ncbi:hypothetical protein GCM10010191_39780 [Actinomadura vinacea]|uniref:Uncharacterized protein n=1 Tax=Actinomadura vinacea TaxID=115336 RepID=A0ABP5WCU4_9ACTN
MGQSEEHADDAPTGPLPVVRDELISAESVRRQDLLTAAVFGAFVILLTGALVAWAWPP